MLEGRVSDGLTTGTNLSEIDDSRCSRPSPQCRRSMLSISIGIGESDEDAELLEGEGGSSSCRLLGDGVAPSSQASEPVSVLPSPATEEIAPRGKGGSGAEGSIISLFFRAQILATISPSIRINASTVIVSGELFVE